MSMLIKSRSESQLGHVGSKTRSLGQILENPLVHFRGHSFDPSSSNFVRMLISIKSRSSSKRGHVGSNTRSLGQILDIACVHSRGHNFEESS